ncbi:MAG: hypothetical protein ACYC9H_03235 [Sulfuricaulis sp.]
MIASLMNTEYLSIIPPVQCTDNKQPHKDQENKMSFWLIPLLLLMSVSTVAAPDYAREKRRADLITPGIVVGDPVYIQQQSSISFWEFIRWRPTPGWVTVNRLMNHELIFFDLKSEHSGASGCESFSLAGGHVTDSTSGQDLVLIKALLYTIPGISRWQCCARPESDSSHVKENRDVMANASGQHEQMPDTMRVP